MTMADTSVMSASPHREADHSMTGALLRTLVIGLTAFLTIKAISRYSKALRLRWPYCMRTANGC